MTRIPEAGRVKTRLIPALGADGAVALHAALLDCTLRTVEAHSLETGINVEVRFTGGDTASVDRYRHAYTAKSLTATWREQHGTDLGDRLHCAIHAACGEGAQAVVVIGTDCPDLSPEVLRSAWNSL